MKKILGFDSWTMASNNYARLVNIFKENGYELILIHIGSWGHDKGRLKEEKINGLLVRDISYYKNMSILEIFKQEKPEAIIFLSTKAFAHQTANLYAMHLKIPTLHLYHGIVSVQSVNSNAVKAYKRSFYGLLTQLYQRFWKNFTLLIPTILIALMRCKMPLSYWRFVFRDIFTKINNPLSQATSPLIKTTLGCIYTEADRMHMKNTYMLKDYDIYSVGNPDLITFGFSSNDIGCSFQVDKSSSRNDVVYIDTSLVQAGYVFDNFNQYFNHLLLTEKYLMKFGFSMCFKPHPDHYHNGNLLELLEKSTIRVIHKDNFMSEIRTCSAVIVEPSTLSLIPALMGKLILLANYGKLSSQTYGDVLVSYPYSIFLKDLNTISELNFKISKQIRTRDFESWVEQNSGPMPPENMPERVFNALKKYLIQ